MVLVDQVRAMEKIREAILTVHRNTGNQSSSRHPRVPACLAWFRKEADRVLSALRHPEKKEFFRETRRVERFLESRRPEERALVIFAGKKIWSVIPLQTGVENEMHWGKPALAQSFRLLNGHPAVGVLVVDHQAARLFMHRLGELNLLEEKKFEIDKSGWKQKELGHVTGECVQKTRGSNRDVYEHRMEAQYERLCHETAEEAIRLWKEFEFAGLFLVGPDRLVNLLRTKLPRPFSPFVISIAEDLGKFTPHQILKRVGPHVREFEQKRQLTLVVQLLFEEGKFQTNPDETLAQIQNGNIHTVLVASGLDLRLHECIKCGFVTGAGDSVCGRCGGELRNVSLLEVLPGLAAKHHIKVEFVGGKAAEELAKIGGIGGWRRQADLRATG